jgi:hypothetical protein
LGKPLVLALLVKVLLVAAELMATLAAAAAQVKLVCTKGAAATDLLGLTALLMAVEAEGVTTTLAQVAWSRVGLAVVAEAGTEPAEPHRLV